MDTLRNRRAIPRGLAAAGSMLVAFAPLAVEADESILKRMVTAVSPRRAEGPVARVHRRIQERPMHRNDYQDGLVVHAGGAYAGQFDSLEGHGGHAGCRGGQCDDHCVARPDRFGYYGTQWRQWPGTRVVQAAGAEELTPSSPPRLELPTAEEESLDPKAPVEFGVDEPVEDSDATTLPGLGPIVPPQRTTPPPPKPVPPARPAVPETQREPARPDEDSDAVPPKAELDKTTPGKALPGTEEDTLFGNEAVQPAKPTTEEEPEPEPRPEPKPPASPRPPSADDNLFDEAANRRRLQERLAVIRSQARPARVAPVPFPPREDIKPDIRERASLFSEPVSDDAAESARPADVRPTAYDQEARSADPNPLRSSRDRGWRARLVDEARPIAEQ